MKINKRKLRKIISESIDENIQNQMKITRRQLRKLINEVMVGYPDERPPFDASAALKSAKEKMTKDPALADMFSDDKDYDAKRQAYTLGSLTTDLTDDEELAADMASDVIDSKTYGEDSPDYDPFPPEYEQLDPDQRFFNKVDYDAIEQPLQGIIKDTIPKLEISDHRKNPRINQEVTYYLAPDKKYQVVVSERPGPFGIGATEYNVDLRRFNPKINGYEAGNGGRYSDGTRAFFRSTMYTSNFRNVLEDLNKHLKSLGAI